MQHCLWPELVVVGGCSPCTPLKLIMGAPLAALLKAGAWDEKQTSASCPNW